MDHLKALHNKLINRLWLSLLLFSFVPIALWIAGSYFDIPPPARAIVTFIISSAVAYATIVQTVNYVLGPLKSLRQAILHVGKVSSDAPAPDFDKMRLGKEMVSALALQVYDLASNAGRPSAQTGVHETATDSTKMLSAIPLPVISVDSKSNIHHLNEAAMVYLGIDPAKREAYIGGNINDLLNMSFPSEETYESWLANAQKNVVKAEMSWNRVRLVDTDGNPVRQFDLAASFSKGAGDVESVLIFFDHTKNYASEDQEISFVAMAVHELRTPLTIMRGYIEVFEDELGPKLPPDLKDFMYKMNASAQQLTAFVSNILNVARVEENQLTLTLHKEDLRTILESAVQDLELRARVHGKHISLAIAENIPPIAADRISVHEVINNLVDNAIKYGGKSEHINISSVLGHDGMIEVSVQDFGVGIPASIMPKLFGKFFRSHRSRTQIGGTGLGLYLCKAIVTAHGGNIWVTSKEGQGTTFTFSLEPYDGQRHDAEAKGQDGIMRGAHGWIKNHSMYRR